MKVGVKFCGNCNPHVDMPKLLDLLKIQAPEILFGGWEEKTYDVLLILSGCPVDCASRPYFNGPIVVVTSNSVEYWPVSEKNLLYQTLSALERYRK